ncbi:MAG: hypothetical protein KA152_13745 [Verrucomicrobiales bacterium]|nr:hypothetical protein [Verrucomicrobiales bacterium]
MKLSRTSGQLLSGIAMMFSLASPSLYGQDSLADLDSFREGCQALADERFETAVTLFQECWKIIHTSEIGSAEENFVAARLMEALVRDESTSTAIEWVRGHPLLRPSPGTCHWIALAFQKEERFAEAAEYYNLYLSSTPNAGNTVRINRAICLARSEKPEAAFDLVYKIISPVTPEESFRLAQISAAAARYIEALSYLAEINPQASESGSLRFPVIQLRIWILSRTGQLADAIESAYRLVETSPDGASARLALLLLEQLIEGRVPADLANRLDTWANTPNFPGRDAVRLFRIILLSETTALPGGLKTYLETEADPELKLECRLRLAELESQKERTFAEEAPAISTSPDLLDRYSFSLAKANYRARSFDLAAKQFIDLADQNLGEARSRNLFNAAVSALQNDDGTAFTAYEEALLQNNPRSILLANLSYLGGLYFAAKGDPKAFERLNTFIREHPDHPSNVEAQLALAEIHLNQAPARPQVVRDIFEGVRTRPLTLTQSERLDYTAIWVELTDGNVPALVRRAEDFIRDWPSSTYLPEVIMILASEQFKLKNFTAAETNFRLVATNFPASPYTETARFFEAKSSPPNDRTITTWQHFIESNVNLSAEARHELGLLYLSIDRFSEARGQFNWLVENLPPGSNLRFAAIADLGFCSYIEALANDRNPAMLDESAKIFASLSNMSGAPAFWRYNAAVRRGKCLEALGRAPIALQIYRSIVDETKSDSESLSDDLPARETEWVFRAGFAAIDILTAEQNWAAAIAVADTLSNKNGPRVMEATRLAESLRLKHWVWD